MDNAATPISPLDSLSAGASAAITAESAAPKKPRKPAGLIRRLLRRLLIGSLILLALILGLMTYILGTESGLKQSLALLNRFTPVTISYQTLTGSIWSGLQYQALHISMPETLSFSSQSGTWHWQPSDLLDKRLLIKQVAVNNSHLQIISRDSEPSPFSTEQFWQKWQTVAKRPSFRFPWMIEAQIEQLSIENFQFSVLEQGSALKLSDEPPTDDPQSVAKFSYLIKQIKAEASLAPFPSHLVSLNISQLESEDTQGHLSATLDLEAPFITTLTGEVDFSRAPFDDADNSQHLQLSAHGSLAKDLQLNLTATGLAEVSLQAQVKQLFDAPQLHLKTQAKQLQMDAPAIQTWYLSTLAGLVADADLTLAVTAEQATLTGAWHYFTALSEQVDGDLSLRADNWQSVKFADLKLALHGNLQSNRYSAVNLSVASMGNFLDETAIELHLKQFTKNKPGNGAKKEAKPTSTVAEDNLTINGTLALAESTFQADIRSQKFALQPYLPTLAEPVQLNADIHVAGQLQAPLQLAVQIRQLDGLIGKQPLKGSGKVQLHDRTLNIADLNLDLAGNRLIASGKLTEKTMDLQAQIDASQLSRLNSQMEGDIQGRLQLKGDYALQTTPRKLPLIDSNLQGKNLKIAGLKFEKFNLQSQLNQATDQLLLELNSGTIQRESIGKGKTVTSQRLIESANLSINGKWSQHAIKAVIKRQQQDVNLTANGGFSLDKLAWQGQIQQLGLSDALIGDWKLAQAAKLSVSPNDLTIDNACLLQGAEKPRKRGSGLGQNISSSLNNTSSNAPSTSSTRISRKNAKLCVMGDLAFATQTGEMQVSLNDFDTRTFRNWMPDNARLFTIADLQADLNLKPAGLPDGKLSLTTHDGLLNLSAGKGRFRQKIETFNLDATLKNNQLTATGQFLIPKFIEVSLNAKSQNLQKQDLLAQAKIRVPDLAFVEKMLVDLTGVKGSVVGDINLVQQQDRFSLSGDINLQSTDFNVPKYGSQIRNLNLSIQAKQNELQFSGGAKSLAKDNTARGALTIDGTINPFTQQGQVNIGGENFRLADSHEVMVDLSPNIQLKMDKTLTIAGDILIPEALIRPKSSTSKVSTSADIIDPKPNVKKSSDSLLQMDLGVKLGENVKIASADFSTRLLGGIRILAEPHKAITAAGEVRLDTGDIRLYGQNLLIERGRVIFAKGPIDNPSLDIRASRHFDDEDVTVGASVLGTVNKPAVSLFSTPSMPDSSILSYLIFGHAPNSDSFSTLAVLQTTGVVGANTISGDLKKEIGLDVLNFNLSGLEAGKNLTKAMYVGINSSFFDNVNQLLFKYKLSKRLRLEATGTAEESWADFIYSYEKD